MQYGIEKRIKGTLYGSRVSKLVSPTRTDVRFLFCFSTTVDKLTTEVAKLIEDKIDQNNGILLASVKSLLDSSVQQLKRSSTENAKNQLKEIKWLKYAEQHNFKKKANEDQFEFNTKLVDSLADLSKALETKKITKALEALQTVRKC